MQGIIVVQVSNEGNKPETCEKQNENQKHPFLEEIEREIAKLERIGKEVAMRHTALSHIREDLLETLGLSGKPEGKEPEETKTSPEPETPLEAENEPSPDTDAPTLTEKEQLEMLEHGLRYAVGVLENTKMAYYFKAIKELRESLAALVKDSDMPVPERIAKLEAGLSHGVKVLGESTCAAKSKVTRNLREKLIALLENNA